MMRFRVGHVALPLAATLLVAGCSSFSSVARGTRDLNNRLQARLAPEIDAGHVTVQALPDGARVTLDEQATFPRGGSEMADTGRNALTGVIQSLLNPAVMQVAVTDSPSTPANLQDARIGVVTQTFRDAQLGPVLLPAPAADVASTGLAITINVVPR